MQFPRFAVWSISLICVALFWMKERRLTEPWIRFGGVIRKHRIACGFSQAELAELVGRHYNHIGFIERGAHMMSLELFLNLAKALGLTPQRLLASAGLYYEPPAIKRPVPLLSVTPEDTPAVTPKVKKMLMAMTGEMPRKEIQKRLGLTDEKHFRECYLQSAVRLGLIEMTVPKRPNSRLQKYRLTAKGKAWLAANPVHGAPSSSSH
jgi:transcriptional regulator with XRE-family HTH domain